MTKAVSISLVASLWIHFAWALASNSPTNHNLFLNSRADALNILNHPLQLQLATGELPMGSFQRLLRDRATLIAGLQTATGGIVMEQEMEEHASESKQWLNAAEAAGKTIVVPGIACYTCGGEHLNVDCPEDSQEASPSVLALKSVLETNGLAGASAVLRSYSFACATLLEVASGGDPSYYAWLQAHAERWSVLATACEEKLGNAGDASSYALCLSMFYNWIDSEAATTGIRATGDSTKYLMEALEELEPGYAAQHDKHQSYVTEVTKAEAKKGTAAAKVSAAAAYLAAKKKRQQ